MASSKRFEGKTAFITGAASGIGRATAILYAKEGADVAILYLNEGEDARETAKRELAEEIGKGAREWTHLTTYWSSVGFTDEEVHVYLATDLYDEDAESEENERIEIETVPLDRLDDVIRDCRDAKTLIGLLWLKAFES